MKFFNRSILPLVLFISAQFLFADPPVWQDDPGGYQFVSWIVGGIVLNDGVQMGDDGDMFAAFDDAGDVRGVGVEIGTDLDFGPYAGTPVLEMTMRSNADGDIISFKYYDASEDAILDITETNTFATNEQLGDVIEPAIFNVGIPDYSCPECADDDSGVAPCIRWSRVEFRVHRGARYRKFRT